MDSYQSCFATTKRWNFLQGDSVQGLDMGLVHKTSETCGTVCCDEHTQTSHQETLDLHNITSTELELIRANWTVVGDCYTGTRH